MSTFVHHATCVAIGGRAVLIEGESGSGKSTLALSLIDRGAELIGDDGVTLTQRGERLWASPPPNIAGLIEIRNLGVVQLPTSEGPVALVLRLEEQAPRFVEHADPVFLSETRLPMIRLWPGGEATALRAEWALKLYGVE